MEKFINNLYSNSNFPIILFSLIAIFIVLFIITLILALKDAKNNVEEDKPQKEENKDKVEFKKQEEQPVSESKLFEDITFDKNEESSKDDKEEPKKEEVPKQEEPTDVILETTKTIPVLKDEEISNFEEFFLENLKEKKEDTNFFDFSNKEENNQVPKDMELPKIKGESDDK